MVYHVWKKRLFGLDSLKGYVTGASKEEALREWLLARSIRPDSKAYYATEITGVDEAEIDDGLKDEPTPIIRMFVPFEHDDYDSRRDWFP